MRSTFLSGLALLVTICKPSLIIALTTIGTLKPSAQSQIGSTVSGRVDEIFVDIGDSVIKGQPLVKLDASLLSIEVAQKKALVDLAEIETKDAETHFRRMQNLWDKPIGITPSIPQKKYEDALIRYQQAKIHQKLAEENLKRAQVNLDDATIKAPFNGVISKRWVDVGDSVTATPVTEIMEILGNNPLYLEFSLSQTEVDSIKAGAPVNFTVEGGSSESYSAVIDRIYPYVDEQTRSIRFRAIVPNEKGVLRPGSLAKVEVKPS